MSSTALSQTPSSSGSLTRRDAGQPERKNSNTPSSESRQMSQGSQPQSSPQVQTPQAQTTSTSLQEKLKQSVSRTPTAGQWEHPRMEEILSRQRRTVFDQTNAKWFLKSTAALVMITFAPAFVVEWSIPRSVSKLLPGQLIWFSYILQLFFLANMLAAIMPLLRKKDPVEDIPLTPRQRQLMNLPPMSRPATPQEQAAWVTPPRYSRNTTPTSVDSLLVNARNTPLSGRNSPLGSFMSSTPSGGQRSNNSASFVSSGSRRASDMSLRRESFGTPRGSPQAFNEFETIGQMGKSSRLSGALNSKWLYDKGKTSPKGAAFLGPGWGTGSVFN